VKSEKMSSSDVFPFLLLFLSILRVVLSFVDIAINSSESNSIDDSHQQLLALSYAIMMEVAPNGNANNGTEPS